jgi:hypothetical protein
VTVAEAVHEVQLLGVVGEHADRLVAGRQVLLQARFGQRDLVRRRPELLLEDAVALAHEDGVLVRRALRAGSLAAEALEQR